MIVGGTLPLSKCPERFPIERDPEAGSRRYERESARILTRVIINARDTLAPSKETGVDLFISMHPRRRVARLRTCIPYTLCSGRHCQGKCCDLLKNPIERSVLFSRHSVARFYIAMSSSSCFFLSFFFTRANTLNIFNPLAISREFPCSSSGCLRFERKRFSSTRCMN